MKKTVKDVETETVGGPDIKVSRQRHFKLSFPKGAKRIPDMCHFALFCFRPSR